MSKKIYQQTEADLKSRLREQIEFLRRSCKSYDEGFEGEGKRLALCIRILVHDTSKSVSLLRLLKKKDIDFCDTSLEYDPRNYLAQTGLCQLMVEKKLGVDIAGRYVPRLNSCSTIKKVPFENWWNKIIIKDSKSKYFTRKNLVLIICNKDGGAHIDPELNMDFAALSKFNSGGWETYHNGQVSPFKNGPELASIRQIAYEVLLTLEETFPDLK